MSELFDIHHRLIGADNQKMIEQTKIAIVGVGGLGCVVSKAAAQLGVGCVTLIDSDTIELSNLPRQGLFSKQDIGQLKVKVAHDQLIKLASNPLVNYHQEIFTLNNGNEFLKNVDIVIDCTDNYAARYAISKVSAELKIPMVYGGVSKFEGQVGVFNFKNSPAFHQAFPNIEDFLHLENCEDSGVLPFVVNVIGNLQVTELFKIITNHSAVLTNKLLCCNLLSGKQRILSLKTP